MSGLYGNPRHMLAEAEARAALAAFDRLAILVTHGAEGLAASQIPILVEGDTILAHVARANAQWKHAPCAAMVILQGAESYVSPGWYETKKRDARAVPTWNYEIVHVWGEMRAFEDSARLRDVVSRLSDRHEAAMPEPWSIADAPADFIDLLTRHIVGVEIAIARVEGKRKLSQEKPADDQAGVIAALAASPDARDRAVAEAMRKLKR